MTSNSLEEATYRKGWEPLLYWSCPPSGKFRTSVKFAQMSGILPKCPEFL